MCTYLLSSASSAVHRFLRLRFSRRLGLHYIKFDRDQAAPGGTGPALEMPMWPGEGKPGGADKAAPPPAPTSAQLLLRFSPPHAHGHWQQPDNVTQAQLRRCYQGAALGWLAGWLRLASWLAGAAGV